MIENLFSAKVQAAAPLFVRVILMAHTEIVSPKLLIVKKFGGTSVGTPERICAVAQLIANSLSQGNQVVAVVSAMAGETNRLVGLAHAIHSMPWGLEYDMLLAAGEQQSVALLALALKSIGVKAEPLLAHQVGIRTDSLYSKARIKNIDTEKLRRFLEEGTVPVIAGFQGVDETDHITTLGRGGSDTSAVALAAALGADDCEIYTDVEGIYTTDPRLCPKATKLNEICYEEMIELASLGAKVMQIRSVELAAKYRVPLHVRSSFSNVSGTRIVGETTAMEDILVSGVAADSDCARITLKNLPDATETLVGVFGPIANAGVVVDIIVQNRMEDRTIKVSFTVSEVEARKVKAFIEEELVRVFPQLEVEMELGLGKVSVVGVGMRNHPGVAAKAFAVLADIGVAISLIATSEIKISMVVTRSALRKCVERLHEAFGLNEKENPIKPPPGDLLEHHSTMS